MPAKITIRSMAPAAAAAIIPAERKDASSTPKAPIAAKLPVIADFLTRNMASNNARLNVPMTKAAENLFFILPPAPLQPAQYSPESNPNPLQHHQSPAQYAESAQPAHHEKNHPSAQSP